MALPLALLVKPVLYLSMVCNLYSVRLFSSVLRISLDANLFRFSSSLILSSAGAWWWWPHLSVCLVALLPDSVFHLLLSGFHGLLLLTSYSHISSPFFSSTALYTTIVVHAPRIARTCVLFSGCITVMEPHCCDCDLEVDVNGEETFILNKVTTYLQYPHLTEA